jgi:enolase
MMNILNGGAHADNPIDFQEFMVMPVGAPTSPKRCAAGGDLPRAEVALHQQGWSTGVGDEGRFRARHRLDPRGADFIVQAVGQPAIRRGRTC